MHTELSCKKKKYISYYFINCFVEKIEYLFTLFNFFKKNMDYKVNIVIKSKKENFSIFIKLLKILDQKRKEKGTK